MSYPYQTEGSLPHLPDYIPRDVDQKLYQTLLRGESCLLTAQQVGQSSLLMQQLQDEGVKCSSINLMTIGSKSTTSEQWYRGIMNQILKDLQLTESFDLTGFCKKRSDLGWLQRLRDFATEILLHYLTAPLVVFVDKIDSTIILDFDSDDFFDWIRCYGNQQADPPHHQRLTFCLLEAATLSDPIQAGKSPVNLGTTIESSQLMGGQNDNFLVVEQAVIDDRQPKPNQVKAEQNAVQARKIERIKLVIAYLLIIVPGIFSLVQYIYKDVTWVVNIGQTAVGIAYSPASALSQIKSFQDALDVRACQINSIEHPSFVQSVAVSDDGQTIASSSEDNLVKIWQRDGTLLNTFSDSQYPVKVLQRYGNLFNTFSNHEYLSQASSSDKKTIVFYNKTSSTPISTSITLQQNTTQIGRFSTQDWVDKIGVSNDGQTIVSSNFYKKLKVWRRDGTLLATLSGHQKPIRSVAVSADGQTIVSGGYDKSVKVWHIDYLNGKSQLCLK